MLKFLLEYHYQSIDESLAAKCNYQPPFDIGGSCISATR